MSKEGSDQKAAEFKAMLAKYNVPQEELARMDELFVPAAEFTKLRQQDKADINAMNQRLVAIEQRPAQQQADGGQQSVDPIDAAMVKRGYNREENPKVYGQIRDMVEMAREQAEQSVAARYDPTMNMLAGNTVDQKVQQLRTQLTSQLGDGVERYWPEVEQKARESLQYGFTPDPVAIMRTVDGDAYNKLFYEAETKRREQANKDALSSTSEGFVKQEGLMFGEPANGQTQEPGADPSAPVSFERLAIEIAAEMPGPVPFRIE